MHLCEQLGICPVMVDPVLLNENDRTSFYHCLVRLVKEAICLILVDKGNNMGTKHIGTRGLVCLLETLKVFPDINEGLFGIDRVPSWVVFPVEVVVMLLLP